MNFKYLTGCLFFIYCFLSNVYATDNEKIKDYEFTELKKIPITSIKDQHRSGTCWSFSVLSMLESEILQSTNVEYDLSEMYIVRTAYAERAKVYVRMHGTTKFSGGGALNDPITMMKKYGIVPETVYNGLKIGEKKHFHYEMDDVLKGYVDKVIENENGRLSPVWHDGFEKLLDTYLGEIPQTFNYDGEEYTPQSFLKKLNINLDDYALLTSYSHHPFYESFVLEVPDNWSWGEAYNLPLDEFKQTLIYSIENGYSFAWATDISDEGYQYRKGFATVPEKDWREMTDDEINMAKQTPVSQRKITQEMRQEAFDNYSTEDDHGMQVYGLAKDQNGTDYFIVKNSWSIENSEYDGIFYASESYVLYKTMSVLLNKNGIPQEIRNKLGL